MKNEKENKDEEQDFSFSVGSLKKPIFWISIIIGFGGIFLAIVLAIIVNGVLDSAEKAVMPQLDALGGVIKNIEDSVQMVADSSGDASMTVTDLKTSTSALQTGIKTAADSMSEFGNTLKGINFGVISLASYGTQIAGAGAELEIASNSLANVSNDLESHKKSISDLKTSIEELKTSITVQKSTLAKAKSEITNMFSGLRLANIIVAVLFISMFFVLLLNALGGLLGA